MIHREIEQRDDAALAKVIRQVLTEFGANKPGFAWADPELDRLSAVYQQPMHHYRVVELNNQLVGGGGIAPFECGISNVCELQKMYFVPEARQRGYGEQLLDALLDEARRLGYRHCYLETFGPMLQAQSLYQKAGFKPLNQPWGDSGHTACDKWYALELS